MGIPVGTFAFRTRRQLLDDISHYPGLPRTPNFSLDLIDPNSTLVINGSYYTGIEEPDLKCDSITVLDENKAKLDLLLEALLTEGKSFTIQTGLGPNQRTVVWRVKKA